MAFHFDRELLINLDASVLSQISDWNRAEMQMNICDALHAPGLFGGSTFIVFRSAGFCGFEIHGEVSPEVDAAAWEEVERWVMNAIRCTRIDAQH